MNGKLDQQMHHLIKNESGSMLYDKSAPNGSINKQLFVAFKLQYELCLRASSKNSSVAIGTINFRNDHILNLCEQDNKYFLILV